MGSEVCKLLGSKECAWYCIPRPCIAGDLVRTGECWAAWPSGSSPCTQLVPVSSLIRGKCLLPLARFQDLISKALIIPVFSGHAPFICIQRGRTWMGPVRNRQKLGNFHLFYFRFYSTFIFLFICFNWRLITLQHCSGFCHTLTWIYFNATTL